MEIFMNRILVLAAAAVLVQFMAIHGLSAPPQVPAGKDLERKENWKKCFSGDCKNGTGAYIYGQGNYYVGEWKDGKRHGMGKYYFSKSKDVREIYEGEYQNDYRHGKGAYRFMNSGYWDETYEGDYAAGKRHGHGTFTITEYRGKLVDRTLKYTGGFGNGEYHGKGELVETAGTLTTKYTGDFLHGQKHGKGELTSPDGSKYTGEFSGDKFHGKGILVKCGGRR
jgi:hypothetical protein